MNNNQYTTKEMFDKIMSDKLELASTLESIFSMIDTWEDSQEDKDNYFRFYKQIIECINNNTLETVTEEEKEQFLTIHRQLIKMLNEQNI